VQEDVGPPSEPVELGRKRWIYFFLGWIFFALGVAGGALPLMPGTPFMLLALWAFSRSSRRFHDWLYYHRWFGPSLRRWQAHRVVPNSVRALAYLSMLATLSYTAFFTDVHVAVVVIVAAVMVVGVVFISLCPSAPPAESPGSSGEPS